MDWRRKLGLLLAVAAVGTGTAADVTIVDASERAVVRYQRSYALLVGVSDYTAGWDDLPSVPAELEEVRGVLEGHGFEVETVLDPGEDRLRAAIESFIDRYGYGVENRLLIFFAGHGHSRSVDGRRRGYLVPADAPLPSAGRVREFLRRAVPMTQVLTWARQIEARHALFVFDSCFSGSVFDTRSELPEPAHITAPRGAPPA